MIKYISKLFLKEGKNWTLISDLSLKMSSKILAPPTEVKNMKLLNRESFLKRITVFALKFNKENFSQVSKIVNRFILKLQNFDSVLSTNNERVILLNPELIKNKDDANSIIDQIDNFEATIESKEIEISYANWSKAQILQAVLTDEASACSSFSIIGHILHLNLKDDLLPYKNLIGQVLLDKVKNVSIVVNKTDSIDSSDNSFRSFCMEVLAGEGDMIATVKSNDCRFTFDFSKVYWNPRLSTEHSRILSKLKSRDILFDIMAGVGPFSIPAGKKKCTVYANDLNPCSFEFLKKNCTGNKVESNVKCFNMDANEFIKSIFKEEYIKVLKDDLFNGQIHLTMNLPSIASTFLPSFSCILSSSDITEHDFDKLVSENPGFVPIVHVYLFIHEENIELAKHVVASELGFAEKILPDVEKIHKNFAIDHSFNNQIIEVFNVRRVAPSKLMMRVSFRMPKAVLYGFDIGNWPPNKRYKLSS